MNDFDPLSMSPGWRACPSPLRPARCSGRAGSASLGLTDTVLGITLPYLAAGYTVFLLRQAFLAFPREVWEAAMLDGCGHVRCLVRVVLPMTSQAVATAAMWSALAAWNGYFWPLLIADTASARTIQWAAPARKCL